MSQETLKYAKVVFGDAKLVKRLLEGVQALVDEVTVTVCHDGLHIREMDPSHVAMVDLNVPREALEEITAVEPVRFRVDLKKLLGCGFKRVKNEESLRLEVNQCKETTLTLSFRGSFGKDYEFKGFDATEEDPPTPKINFNAEVKLLSKALKEAVEDMSTIASDYNGGVKFAADNEQFIVSTENEDTGKCKVKMDKCDERILGLQAREPSIASFKVSYLKTIASEVEKLGEVATVSFSKLMPVKIQPDINYNISFVYYLAPIITED